MADPSARYTSLADLPETIPLFPLTGALLLPRADMPLNIFEPRYLAMVERAMSGARIIGMVQPAVAGAEHKTEKPTLQRVGCAGRITAYAEQADGRILVTLAGVARFEIVEELAVETPFRQARVDFVRFADDLVGGHGEEAVDRPKLLKTLADYLEAHDLTTDWDAIAGTDTERLVNALAMMSPFGAREKQALLEADGLATRSEVLIALTEMTLAGGAGNRDSRLQ